MEYKRIAHKNIDNPTMMDCAISTSGTAANMPPVIPSPPDGRVTIEDNCGGLLFALPVSYATTLTIAQGMVHSDMYPYIGDIEISPATLLLHSLTTLLVCTMVS
jgi:hypothetical protein